MSAYTVSHTSHDEGFQETKSLTMAYIPTLLSQNGEITIGDEVSALLPRYFAVFFDDVKALAPQLAHVKLCLPETVGKNLH